MDADHLNEELTSTLQKAMNLEKEMAFSSWLTALPIEEHGFHLYEGAFVYALAMKYGWIPA